MDDKFGVVLKTVMGISTLSIVACVVVFIHEVGLLNSVMLAIIIIFLIYLAYVLGDIILSL